MLYKYCVFSSNFTTTLEIHLGAIEEVKCLWLMLFAFQSYPGPEYLAETSHSIRNKLIQSEAIKIPQLPW